MKKKLTSLVLALIFIFTTVLMPVTSFAKQNEVRKIVVFKAGVDDAEKDKVLTKIKAQKIKDIKSINAVVVKTKFKKADKKLKNFNEVLKVEDDIIFSITKGTTPTQPAQSIPWGIKTIDANDAWVTTTANGVKVGVIDTGIDLLHPDLKANIAGGINCINSRKSAADDNGHGTHVAGIIGALNNPIGVVGVGPSVELYSIKVLGASGSGYLSDIIEGLDWAVKNNLDVVNMSLGTTADSDLMHDAIQRAYNAGIVLVAAAGNDYGKGVNFPGAYPEVIAVTATDSNDVIANFSSIGPEVDIAAPGVSVFSTYKGSAYATMSGTSMATPHVAGAAAMLIADYIKNGVNWTPAMVEYRLETTAVDEGDDGWDKYYGAGIVNVYNAIK